MKLIIDIAGILHVTNVTRDSRAIELILQATELRYNRTFDPRKYFKKYRVSNFAIKLCR